MSDAASVFASAWTYKNLRLPQLKGPQYGELESAARNRCRTNLVVMLDDLKADLSNRIILLKEFDSRLPRLSQTAAHLETWDGASQAVILSLVSGGMSQADARIAVNDIPIADLTQLAMKVSTLNKLYPDADGFVTAGTPVTEDEAGKK